MDSKGGDEGRFELRQENSSIGIENQSAINWRGWILPNVDVNDYAMWIPQNITASLKFRWFAKKKV